MNAITTKIEIVKTLGYSGNNSGKAWLARIEGTDGHFGFRRDFVETSAVDKAAMMKVRRNRKGCWTESADCGPGVYESQDYNCGHRWMIITESGEMILTTEDRVKAMCRLMDDARDLEHTEPTVAEMLAATESL